MPTNKLGLDVAQTFEAISQQGKFSQPDANYRPESESNVCGTCRFYLRDEQSTVGQCQVVDGPINWNGTSDLYISAEMEAAVSLAGDNAYSEDDKDKAVYVDRNGNADRKGKFLKVTENNQLESFTTKTAHPDDMEEKNMPIFATSFEELEIMEEAQEVIHDMEHLTKAFAEMSSNILMSVEIEDKAAALTSLANEFSQRVSNPMDDKEIDNTEESEEEPCVDCDEEEVKQQPWQPVTDKLFNLIADFKQAECKTEGGTCYPASDYAYVPDSTKPSTWKLRMSQGRPGNITISQLGRAAAAFSSGGFRGNRVQIPANKVSGVKSKLRAKYRGLDASPPDSIKELQSFDLWENKETGKTHWLAVYSNNIIDKEQEIISSDSHRRFVEMVDKEDVPLPELWLWHRPEWRWGKATNVAYDENGFAIATGMVDDNPAAKEIANWIKERDDILVSHGMPKQSIKRDADDNNIIIEHTTKEISPLFNWAAANDITNFFILKESAMAEEGIPEGKRQELLKNNVSPETLAQLETQNKDASKEADEEGLARKETVEVPEANLVDLVETIQFLTKEIGELKHKVGELEIARIEKELNDTPVISLLAQTQSYLDKANSVQGSVIQPPGPAMQPAEPEGIFIEEWMTPGSMQ